MYVLDEPTADLHLEDIRELMVVPRGLVEESNTVIVIEHNLNVIKCADWVIDLGPKGGEDGELLVATGTPKQVAQVPQSFTGQYLAEVPEPSEPRSPEKIK